MSKRNALGRHRAGATRTNSIAGISKAVAANAGSFGRSAAVVAAASGMVLTLGVPAQANPAAREAAAAPMDALNIERVALQSAVVAPVVAPSADVKKVEAGQRASVKTAPAPKPVTVAVKAEERSEVADVATSAQTSNVSASVTAAAEAQAAANRAAAEERAAERREAAEAQSSNAFAPVTRTNRTATTSTAPKPVSSSVNTGALSGIAATASRYAGVPYVWGGSSPSGWDCSGFVQWVYKQHGISVSRGTSAILGSGQFVRTSNPKPGDLVFQNGGGHVGIYLGNGMMIGAQNPTVDTMIHSVDRNPLYGYYTLAR